MRELKFRAWIPKYEPDITSGDSAYAAHMTEPFGLFDVPNDLPEEVVIQQFIGLKDKNGKEIYEGDIVKTKSDRDGSYACDGLRVVEFDSGQFRLEAARTYGYKGGWGDSGYCGGEHLSDSIWFKTAEIIGNIYENPELVKP